MPDVLELARALIERPSVTPDDAGCQELVAAALAPHGFTAEAMPAGNVANLWLRHGTAEPLLMLAGHTDVVPPGPVAQWRSEPFVPTLRDGCLYGRGAADMKGGVAAMAAACAEYVAQQPEHAGSIGLLLTSDEEGPAIHGTRAAMDILKARGDIPRWCLVGEPSCRAQLGDTLKNGRRGSLSGRLTVRGIQGHIAYPDACDNPIHRFSPVLQQLLETAWDDGNDDFPPTRFQISNLNSGTGAGNVIPGELTADFNWRYSTEVTAEQLQARLQDMLQRARLDSRLDWQEPSRPYLTPPGHLTQACQDAVAEVLGVSAALSTEGGTSDGRFIRPTGAEVVEFGPINLSIHKIDEHIAVRDLEQLVPTYRAIIGKLLG